MREILFRGKALSKYPFLEQKNGWVYGIPVPIKFDAYMTERVEIVKCHGYDELDYYELLSEHDEVDPKTVGQFTGMLDKNGEKIFEDDIVKTIEGPFKVVCEHGAFWLYDKLLLSNDHLDFLGSYETEAVEVIGNIYDNPELLEE